MDATPGSVADHGGASLAHVVPDPGSLRAFRESVINADVLDAWYDPAPGVIQALSGDLSWLCRTSPPVYAYGLAGAIAKARSLDEGTVLAAGGSSEIIHLLLRQELNALSKVVMLDPMYGEYSHVVGNLIGAEIDYIRLFPANNFRVEPDEVTARAKGANALVLVNPNNPTGYAIPSSDLVQILESLDPKTLFIVDETYVDFVQGQASLEGQVSKYPNLRVIKSMSKFYALSGLRVGYLAAPAATVSELMRFLPPWAVNLLAQVAATEALRDTDYYERMAWETNQLRLSFAQALAGIGALKVYPGAANFILAEIVDPAFNSAKVCAALAEQGIHIRNCSTQGPSMGNHFVRIAVKTTPKNKRMAGALASLLN
ncbi:MAG: pyridoxal phosphate-dependent aminotransferase [Fimbriimonas sp.]